MCLTSFLLYYKTIQLSPVQVHDNVLLSDVGFEFDVDSIPFRRDDMTIVALGPWLVRRQQLQVVVHVAHGVLLLNVEVDQPVLNEGDFLNDVMQLEVVVVLSW